MKTATFGSILAYPSSPHPAFHRALEPRQLCAQTLSISVYNFFLEIWNLDHLVTCGIPYANTYGIPRNSRAILLQKIPRNSVCFSKNSVLRRKSKTHFRGHPSRGRNVILTRNSPPLSTRDAIAAVCARHMIHKLCKIFHRAGVGVAGQEKSVVFSKI